MLYNNKTYSSSELLASHLAFKLTKPLFVFLSADDVVVVVVAAAADVVVIAASVVAAVAAAVTIRTSSAPPLLLPPPPPLIFPSSISLVLFCCQPHRSRQFG